LDCDFIIWVIRTFHFWTASCRWQWLLIDILPYTCTSITWLQLCNLHEIDLLIDSGESCFPDSKSECRLTLKLWRIVLFSARFLWWTFDFSDWILKDFCWMTPIEFVGFPSQREVCGGILFWSRFILSRVSGSLEIVVEDLGPLCLTSFLE
jgi:hypothetical protein